MSTKKGLDLAMTVETQASGLYIRIANETVNDSPKSILFQIADREKEHLVPPARVRKEKVLLYRRADKESVRK